MRKFIFGIMFAFMACFSFSSCGHADRQQADSTAVDSIEVVTDTLTVDTLNVATDSTEVAE